MNKVLIPVLATIMSASLTGKALAACGGNDQVTGQALVDLISNNTVCASFNGDRWQEQHRGVGSGQLWDYKLGANHPVDPTKQVGNWEVVEGRGQNFVRYEYSGGNYVYRVFGSGVVGDNHSFCGSYAGGVDILNAQIRGGWTNCGGGSD